MLMSKILDAIRREVKRSKKSRYRISKETGITESQLSLLMSGKRGLRYEALELLAENLGLEIVIRPKNKKKGR